MSSVCLKLIKISFLLATFAFAVTGCGSSSSTANNGTGSISAKLVWSSTDSKTKAKTLHKAPDGVDFIQIVVLDSNRKSLGSGSFAASLGTGTVDGIVAGSGYTVEVRGLASGSQIYEGIVKNVTVNVGKNDLGIIEMTSITTATELTAFGSYSTKYITLTASTTPATIYYTTNGKEPVFGNASTSFGISPIEKIFIKKPSTGVSTFLKFFSINSLGAQELTKIKEYIFP